MHTLLRIAMISMALLMAAADSRAQGFDLITAAEAQDDAKAGAAAPPEPPRTRGMPAPKPGQPVIRVVTPNTEATSGGSDGIVAGGAGKVVGPAQVEARPQHQR